MKDKVNKRKAHDEDGDEAESEPEESDQASESDHDEGEQGEKEDDSGAEEAEVWKVSIFFEYTVNYSYSML